MFAIPLLLKIKISSPGNSPTVSHALYTKIIRYTSQCDRTLDDDISKNLWYCSDPAPVIIDKIVK